MQKLVVLTDKNKKLTSDNRRLKMEAILTMWFQPLSRALQLSEVTRERDFAQRELINMKVHRDTQRIELQLTGWLAGAVTGDAPDHGNCSAAQG